jgi:alpha-galactosidase
MGLVAALATAAFTFQAHAVTPSPGELAASRSWADRTFPPTGIPASPSFLRILYEDVSDGITRGRSWRGTPYQLGDRTYQHGLSFNSTKHLLVQLGQPGRRFTAQVGLENNDDTRRGETLGQGSVTFHVLVDGKETFDSPVRRRKDGPLALDVPLQGVQEFEIRVKDGGDGRGWDQALWAEAQVELADGTTVRLQDLPLAGASGTNPFGFSFLYHGSNSFALLNQWQSSVKELALPATGKLRMLSRADPTSGLEVRVEATLFSDFPAVEWVVFLTNTAATNTPLLQNLQAIDTLLPLPATGDPKLHWSKGGVASFDDFTPQSQSFKANSRLRLSAGEGRSSSQVLPFFNLEGANSGIIAAVGWSGNWAAEFSCDSQRQVALKAGLERTHLVLLPGETIRLPRILLLFYEGDRWRGQNLLRQFILTHHRPKHGDQPWIAPITCGNWGATSAEIHLDNIRKIIQHQLPIDYYWIDAEWFGQGGWPVNVGSWELKKHLYPAGFKPLSDALRQSGRELMLWFEPERVYQGTTWYKEHRSWLLDTGGESLLLNLGNPEARRFLTEFISGKVKEFGLGCYRQDFNIDPLPFWRAADAPDRQGITEIKYIEGLYAFWDALLAQNPGLIIDNCASGGRRIDLETVGRATPFWRTDGPRDAIAHQCHTFGLLAWVPLSATSQDRARDDYEFRSSMCSSLCLNWWVSGDVPAERIPADFPFAWAKTTLDGYLKIRDFYYGDYYPLTGYSQENDLWMAYELSRPDQGRGLVVALRRPGSPYESARLVLRGPEDNASYEITNLDTRERTTATGSDLRRTGLAVSLNTRPGSALFLYQRK